MYNDNSVSLRGVFFKILLVVIALFILMYLFPTKGFVTNYVDSKVSSNNSFNNNLLTMATVASGYFNESRLPENTNDKVKITLAEMLDQKMIIALKDDGKSCDSNKSYAIVTKEDSEYTLKVNLSCGNKEDYIVSHMGLSGTQFPSTSTARCEFLKNLDATWSYGNWSSWSSKKVSESDTRQVQTKNVSVKTSDKQVSHETEEKFDATRYIYSSGKTYYVCGNKYDNAGTYENEVSCVKKTVTYTTEPVYSNITYYRYRDKVLSPQTDIKWSDCDDKSLLDDGYVLTGNKN